MESKKEQEKAWTEKFFKALLTSMAERIADLLSTSDEDESDDDDDDEEVSASELTLQRCQKARGGQILWSAVRSAHRS